MCELAATVAVKGNTNAISDAGVAALLAEAGCKSAAYNVRVNIAALDDPSLGRSRADAVADAMARAQAYAKAAGVMLGAIQSISEGGGDVPRPLYAPMMMRAAKAVPVAAGQQSVTANVTIVWALQS